MTRNAMLIARTRIMDDPKPGNSPVRPCDLVTKYNTPAHTPSKFQTPSKHTPDNPREEFGSAVVWECYQGRIEALREQFIA